MASVFCNSTWSRVLLSMKHFRAVCWLAVCTAGFFLSHAQAQERVFRCPGKPVEYINNPEIAKSRGCTLMEGGNITIVEGTTPQTGASPRGTNASRNGAATPGTRPVTERVDPAAQRNRDNEARAILETELRKAEERLAQARKDYADGEPEKQGIESRNYQRYLDRVAELKAAVARAESDVAGIRRELGRLTGTPAPGGASAQ